MRRCQICGKFYRENTADDIKYVGNKDEKGNPKPIEYICVCPHCEQYGTVIGGDVDYNPYYATEKQPYSYAMYSFEYNPQKHTTQPMVMGVPSSEKWERMECYVSRDLREKLELWKNTKGDGEFRQFFTNKDGRYMFCGANAVVDIYGYGFKEMTPAEKKEKWIKEWFACTDWEKAKKNKE
jgi:hypothetical protein